MIPEIKKGIQEFSNQIDPHHIMMFYYKIACVYFGAADYENCIVFLDNIISNKRLKMREDLLCFSRVLNIFAHYEAGFDYHLETHLRETYKFLIKMNDLHAGFYLLDQRGPTSFSGKAFFFHSPPKANQK